MFAYKRWSATYIHFYKFLCNLQYKMHLSNYVPKASLVVYTYIFSCAGLGEIAPRAKVHCEVFESCDLRVLCGSEFATCVNKPRLV